MANTGQIIRTRTDKEFTTVPNEFIHRPDMSMKAKGLLIYLLSLPPNWVIYKREIPNHFTDGIDSIRAAFKELEKMGYVLSIETRNRKGQIMGYNHIVYGESQTRPILPPKRENPDVG